MACRDFCVMYYKEAYMLSVRDLCVLHVYFCLITVRRLGKYKHAAVHTPATYKGTSVFSCLPREGFEYCLILNLCDIQQEIIMFMLRKGGREKGPRRICIWSNVARLIH